MMSQLWIVKVVGEPARLAEFMVTGLEESPRLVPARNHRSLS